jgi:flagellin-like hook-associated protein FlgL
MKIGTSSFQANTARGVADVNKNRETLATLMGKLGSGRDIPRASDDMVRLSTATNLQTKTSSLRSAITNLAQASSMLETMDTALEKADTILKRMDEITTLASSTALQHKDRTYLQVEMNQLTEKIDKIFDDAYFGGVKLFSDAPTATPLPPPATPVILTPIDPPEATEGLFDPDNVGGLQLWLDASDASSITLKFLNNLRGGVTTASGVAGTNTITTQHNLNTTHLKAGVRIRLGGAGATTTADILGADTYTVKSVVGKTITVVETLTRNYAAGTSISFGHVSGVRDKSGQNHDAVQSTDSWMPVWMSEVSSLNSRAKFDFLIDDFLTGATLGINTKTENFSFLTSHASSGGFKTYVSTESFVLQSNRFAHRFGGTSSYANLSGDNISIYTQTGSSGKLYNDGALYHSATAGPAAGTANTVGYSFGRNVSGSGAADHMLGTMSGMIAYTGALSAPAQGILNAYESNKWGISLSSGGVVNYRPGIYSTGYTIDSTAANGTIVGDLEEKLAGVTSYSYSITDNDGSGDIFSINASTGEIMINNSASLTALTDNKLYTLGITVDLGLGGDPIVLEAEVAVNKIVPPPDPVAPETDSPLGVTFVAGENYRTSLTIQNNLLNSEVLFDDEDLNVMTSTAAQTTKDTIADAMDIINQRRAQVNGKLLRVNHLSASQEASYRLNSSIRDSLLEVDVPETKSDIAKAKIRSDMSIAMMVQTNKFQSDTIMKLLQHNKSDLFAMPKSNKQ